MLTDTHTHLHFDHYSADIEEVVHRAQQAEVERILTLGTDGESSLTSAKLSLRFPSVFAAVGIHPTDVHPSKPEDFREIKELAQSNPKVVAIGEIGLDLYWKDVPLKEQLPVLEKMLKIADELNLPVVIHNRDAQKEMQEFFLSHGIKNLHGVMHSFSGTADDTQFYLERGMHVSFTGVITFKNFKQMDTVKSVPMERLLLETDSPFLAPVPKRGKRNEPAFVKHTAQKLADVHSTSLEDICNVTAQNAQNLFGW